jgi:ferredoxin
MPKIIHYRNKCIGCAICYELQPQHWRMSKKDGKATLLHSVGKKGIYSLEIPSTDLKHTKEIVKACPVRVIKLA